MADAATDFLHNKLKELLVDRPDLIKGDTRGEIENLERDLHVFKVFLRDTVRNRKEKYLITEMVKEIHAVVYEIEDIIDLFLTNTIEKSKQTSSLKFGVHSIGKDVEAIKIRVQGLREEIGIPIVDHKHEKLEPPRPPRKRDVVGFAALPEQLIEHLTQETNHLDVISIIGMAGVGKTTIAWEVFTNLKILFQFTTRIWLHISQEFTEKEMFLHILKEFTAINDDIRDRSADELAHMVSGHLERESFLIVMDDVWTCDGWDRLRVALPDHNKYGKVLITSRDRRVGMYASRLMPPHMLRFLGVEESWEVLRMAAGKMDCPPELQQVGQRIAENCYGKPLALVLAGGILATISLSSNITTRMKDWEKVWRHSRSVGEEVEKILVSFSFENLPYHLRACFLYLGLFPEDCEIPALKLIRMWIGEGFVQQELDCSLEETAEKYLDDLIHRNLVKTGKFKLNGKVKTCRIQDEVGDFCRYEAVAGNFLQKFNSTRYGGFKPSPTDMDKYRRVSVHTNCLDFFSLRPSGHHVRSFVCFSKDKFVVSPENSTNIIGAFKLLRVLDVLPFKFTKIDSDLYNLFHMRYIALSCELSKLPPMFNQLLNIQTLIVNTTSRTLEVKADVWNMSHLRHFKTNASATLPKSTTSDKPSAELQTLGLISVESCTKELCDRAPNLKKLGIRGRLSLLFEARNGYFDNLGRMEHLGKLKLINDTYPNPRREEALGFLPPHDRFPLGLTSLTLCATFLSWDHISTLGLLKKLEVLKLKDHAFMGHTWEVEDEGFRSLQFLHIEETDLAFWKASSHHYPKLRGLVLKNCDKLCKIPNDLADIPSFQVLELYGCRYAATSAKEISDVKTLPEGSEFMLSIN